MAHVRGKQLGNRGAALWWLGWHPIVAPIAGAVAGLTLGNAIAIPVGLLLGINVLYTMAAGTAAGAVAGVAAWYRGTQAVNRDYGDVVASVGAGIGGADDGSPTFVLLGDGTGSRPRVEPCRRYDATVLRLGDDAVDVHRGTFDLVDRRPVLDHGTMSLPYDRIRSIEYGGSALTIETTRGDRFVYDAASEPIELIEALCGRADR
ncbi:MAG: hypothetical protein ABEJ28_06965 [Salinigranum sp.]